MSWHHQALTLNLRLLDVGHMAVLLATAHSCHKYGWLLGISKRNSIFFTHSWFNTKMMDRVCRKLQGGLKNGSDACGVETCHIFLKWKYRPQVKTKTNSHPHSYVRLHAAWLLTMHALHISSGQWVNAVEVCHCTDLGKNVPNYVHACSYMEMSLSSYSK